MGTVQEHRGASFLLQNTDPEDVLTPEDMDDEQRMMMRAIKDFARQEVVPVMDKIEAKDIDVIRPLFEKAAELGIFMAEVPEEYGGLGLTVLGIAGMNESRSYLGGFASTVFAHQGIGTLPLINFGTAAQVEKYLSDCMEGRRMAAFALTEPSSGSDAMNIRTTAVLSDDGKHYVVNGAKQWITNAGWADMFILFAKIDGTHFTAFILERDSPGLSVGAHEKLLGLHGSSVCALQLENVKIPAENVLGEIGKGHKVAMCTLNLGRLKMSANCSGYAKKALAVAATYAGERTQFGRPIAEFGLIQRKIADMAARAYAAESVAYRSAGLVYNAIEAMGEQARNSIDVKLNLLTEFSIECALSKVYGSEAFNALADEALQVHGGYGFSEEYAPAKMYRDSRITRIYEGTSEICRLSAAKTILKRASRGELELGAAIDSLEAPQGPRATSDGSLEDLRDAVTNFKKIYLYLYGALSDTLGADGMMDNDAQQFLSSLADVAMETYASESTILRVMKSQARHGLEATALPEALARLIFERSADRIRQESTEVLANIKTGPDLEEALSTIERWLPLPAGSIARRAFVAKTVVERKGVLPEFQN